MRTYSIRSGWMALLGLMALVSQESTALSQSDPQPQRQANQQPGHRLSIRETAAAISVQHESKTILVYNKQVLPTPTGIDPIYQRDGFLHPVKTPAGEVATGLYPADHAHQNGIFAAWVNTTYDGRKVDFWNIHKAQGRVVHSQVIAVESLSDRVRFEVELIHRITQAPVVDVLRERWKVSVFPPDTGRYVFEIATKQVALTDKPLQINKYHYGGMGLRGSSRWLLTKGKEISKTTGMLNNRGSNRLKGNHETARWVSLWGMHDDRPISTTVLCHPKNFRGTQPARLHPKMPYFCFAPCVTEGFVIDKTHPFESRYRYVIADEKPNAPWLNAQWDAFSKSAAAKAPVTK